MFDSANVPVRINKITHDGMDKDDAEIALVNLECEVSPLSAIRAKEIDDYMRRSMYTSTDGEVNAKLVRADFAIPLKEQRVHVRMAPDQDEESFEIKEAKFGLMKVRLSKRTSTWRLLFSMTCSPMSEHHLAQLVDCRLKTRYMTFEPAKADLFSEVGKEASRTRRAAAAADAGEATAH